MRSKGPIRGLQIPLPTIPKYLTNFFCAQNFSGPEPIRISTSMNNDMYNETIERQGKTYHYDPDQDVYYCRYDNKDLSHFDQFGWLYLIVILTSIVWILT